MLLIDCNNNIKCWECKKDCDIREIMNLPSFIFNPTIMNFLKANAGLLLTQGIPLQQIEEELKITAVGLYLSRLKLLGQLED